MSKFVFFIEVVLKYNIFSVKCAMVISPYSEHITMANFSPIFHQFITVYTLQTKSRAYESNKILISYQRGFITKSSQYGLVKNADMRISGYADIRICGYTDIKLTDCKIQFNSIQFIKIYKFAPCKVNYIIYYKNDCKLNMLTQDKMMYYNIVKITRTSILLFIKY